MEKQFNLRSRRAKQRELAVQLRLMSGIENRFARRYQALLNRYARQSARAYSVGGRRGVMIALDSFKRDLLPIWTSNVAVSGNTFGKRVTEEFERSQKRDDTLFQMRLQEYIARYGGEKITQIDDTTRQGILEIIAEAELEGDPIDVISKKIVTRYAAISRVRAATISRTETHSAATYASDAAAEATGLVLEREWLPAEDGRTRESHSQALGQRRKMDEPFDIGGAQLMRPGDPAGPPEETINCRCVVIYQERTL